MKRRVNRTRRQMGSRGRSSRNPLHGHEHRHPRGGGPSTHRHAGAGQLPFPGGAETLPSADAGSSCNNPAGGTIDCNGVCVDGWMVYYWLGDGYCDDDLMENTANFNCAAFNFDNGDCVDNGMRSGGRVRRQGGGGGGLPKPWKE